MSCTSVCRTTCEHSCVISVNLTHLKVCVAPGLASPFFKSYLKILKLHCKFSVVCKTCHTLLSSAVRKATRQSSHNVTCSRCAGDGSVSPGTWANRLFSIGFSATFAKCRLSCQTMSVNNYESSVPTIPLPRRHLLPLETRLRSLSPSPFSLSFLPLRGTMISS